MIYRVRGAPLASGFQLPEAPRWHDDRLWFSDIRAGRLFTVSEEGVPTMVAEFEEPCSGIGFLPDGTPLVSLMPSSRLVRVTSAGPSLHADLNGLGGTHVNDMISDACGRCYVDVLSYQVTWARPEQLGDGARRIPFVIDPGSPEVTDRIVLVAPDGTHRVVADGLLGPNGIAISPQGDRLVVSEWRARRITTFDVDVRDGSLSNRSVLFELGPGGTDGLCLDEEGAVWCASPAAGQCVRISRAGAVVDSALPKAGEHVMACVLGGRDRRTLFMMTNRRPAPSTGTIETVRVDVPGAGRP